MALRPRRDMAFRRLEDDYGGPIGLDDPGYEPIDLPEDPLFAGRAPQLRDDFEQQRADAWVGDEPGLPDYVEPELQQYRPRGVLENLRGAFGDSPVHFSGRNGGVGDALGALAALYANYRINHAGRAREQDVERRNEQAERRAAWENSGRMKRYEADLVDRRERARIARQRTRAGNAGENAVEVPGVGPVSRDSDWYRAWVTSGKPASPNWARVWPEWKAKNREPEKAEKPPVSFTTDQKLRLDANARRFGTRIEQMKAKVGRLEKEIDRTYNDNRKAPIAAKIDSLNAQIEKVAEEWTAADSAVGGTPSAAAPEKPAAKPAPAVRPKAKQVPTSDAEAEQEERWVRVNGKLVRAS